MTTRLAIVVPCFNEEAVLPETLRRLEEVLSGLVGDGRVTVESRIYLVDDGSSDGTWNLLAAAVTAGRPMVGIKLSRNRGHQAALLAGLFTAEGDAILSIDADLQDDVSAIGKMLAAYEGGAEVVYGIRADRSTDTIFKRGSAALFYRLMRAMGAETVDNHADYRLLSRRAVEALRQFREVNLYLRGIIPLIGFSTATVEYQRAPRFAGESKYPLRKMLALGVEAVTSFSIMPLRMISGLGFMVSLLSAALGGWILLNAALGSDVVPGWASTVLPIYFLGGIQLIGIGVIGEYVGRIYVETKDRPRFFIETILRKSETGNDQH